jgi:hypothetical protein
MRLIGACEQTPCPFWNRIDDPVKGGGSCKGKILVMGGTGASRAL